MISINSCHLRPSYHCPLLFSFLLCKPRKHRRPKVLHRLCHLSRQLNQSCSCLKGVTHTNCHHKAVPIQKIPPLPNKTALSTALSLTIERAQYQIEATHLHPPLPSIAASNRSQIQQHQLTTWSPKPLEHCRYQLLRKITIQQLQNTTTQTNHSVSKACTITTNLTPPTLSSPLQKPTTNSPPRQQPARPRSTKRCRNPVVAPPHSPMGTPPPTLLQFPWRNLNLTVTPPLSSPKSPECKKHHSQHHFSWRSPLALPPQSPPAPDLRNSTHGSKTPRSATKTNHECQSSSALSAPSSRAALPQRAMYQRCSSSTVRTPWSASPPNCWHCHPFSLPPLLLTATLHRSTSGSPRRSPESPPSCVNGEEKSPTSFEKQKQFYTSVHRTGLGDRPPSPSISSLLERNDTSSACSSASSRRRQTPTQVMPSASNVRKRPAACAFPRAPFSTRL